MVSTLTTDPKAALLSFLKKEDLSKKKILLMVSGGVDSMVLLHIAVQTIPAQLLHIFHLNHNARKDSKEDTLLIEATAQKYDIGYTVKKLQEVPENNKELFWRNERKRLSQDCAQKEGCVRILTAHHATDLAETMIFNLTKGCGLSGLSPFDLSTKPFWNIPKETLLQYAKEHLLHWNEDSSNTDTDFSRNKIRQEVLPVLREITPNLEQVFVKERLLLGELDSYINHQVEHLAQQNSIQKADFLSLPRYLQISLLRFMAKKTSLDEISDCLRWITEGKEGGKKKMVGECTIKLKQGILSWGPPHPGFIPGSS